MTLEEVLQLRETLEASDYIDTLEECLKQAVEIIQDRDEEIAKIIEQASMLFI